MRILFIHQYLCPPGGTGNNRSWEIAKYWRDLGHEVSFLTSPAWFPEPLRSECQREIKEFELEGIKILSLPVAYSHMMKGQSRIKSFIRFYNQGLKTASRWKSFDLIYASSTPLTVGELGRRLSQKLHIPYVFETVDVWPDVPIGMGIIKNPILIGWLHRRTQKIYDQSIGIVALSEGMKSQILSHGVSPEKVHVSHNGTHLEMFPFFSRPDRSPVTVLYAGTVGVANGLDSLVRVAKRLENNPNIQFWVLGGGNDLVRIKRLAQELSVKNLTFFPPVPKEEVANIFQTADIGIVNFAYFPALEANSANKFYDYLANGLPIVLNYRGWQAEYLEKWGGGLATTQGDEDELEKNIRILAENFEYRAELGKKGRILAETLFSRKKIAEDLIQWIQTRMS